MRNLLMVMALLMVGTLFSQEYTFQTFKDRRIISANSVETLAKRKLDVRITHRFGDIAGTAGGFQTFFGFENAADVLIGAEYGMTDNLNIGLYRTKGAGSTANGKVGLRQLVNVSFKYKLLKQKNDGSMPITLTTYGLLSTSTAKKTASVSSISSFPAFSDRMAFTVQLLIARKFSNALSIQITPSYTHRNLVTFGDLNDVFSVGAAGRLQLTKVIGILADVTVPVSGDRTSPNGYYPSIGIGFDIDTGGHVFQVNLTNSRGILETDYIPYTTSEWNKGQFRIGFTISRLFNL